jgi:hypothetical protein
MSSFFESKRPVIAQSNVIGIVILKALDEEGLFYSLYIIQCISTLFVV